MPFKHDNVGCCGCGTPGPPPGVGLIPNCFCETIPPALSMVSRDEECNYRMFRTGTISYQAVPAALAGLNLGAYNFIGDQDFIDPIAGTAFRYYFTCLFNQFVLSRVYITTPFGSPYRDGILYTWLIGTGNTCSPFLLGNGHAFPGSDPSCSVTISG